MAEKIFSRILAMGCRSVHIGGGEPLLNPDKLVDVLRVAASTGVGIDYVETNSAWFVDPAHAEGVLEQLRSAGVTTLLVSISPFHNAFIPYDRVNGVIEACRKFGMQVFPWVNAFVRDLTRLDIHQTHTMDEFEDVFGIGYLERIADRYWIHLGGRALQTFSGVYPTFPVKQILERHGQGCLRPLSDTTHFHIDLHGNYVPGLCAGLAIEMDDLGDKLPCGKYPLLEQLACAGIRGLFRLAEDFGYRPLRSGYLNHCDLCTDIREYLWQLEGHDFAELAPNGFYG